MKRFDIPEHYRSPVITRVKEWRRIQDPRKKDLSPTVLDFGEVVFYIPRHMGFCYGVENAIEISFRALHENPGKKIFLLSQMIHNPAVNRDLEERGIHFIMDTEGNQLIPWTEVHKGDIVITPAFGTTVEIENLLAQMGVELSTYNTTCPFVEKVWKRSAEIGARGYTVIIHGKHRHEETRATFSHSNQNAPSIIIRDRKEAELLASAIRGEMDSHEFSQVFEGRYSAGFDLLKDLKSVGVVNQTTMLASETQEIADFIKQVVEERHGEGSYADTRDTLCYATNDNQDATMEVLNAPADLALVIGGYNSSNTAQLVSILEQKMKVYFISGADKIISGGQISHFKYASKSEVTTNNWLPAHRPVRVVLTSGASCPDAEVEAVLQKVLVESGASRPAEDVIRTLVGEG